MQLESEQQSSCCDSSWPLPVLPAIFGSPMDWVPRLSVFCSHYIYCDLSDVVGLVFSYIDQTVNGTQKTTEISCTFQARAIASPIPESQYSDSLSFMYWRAFHRVEYVCRLHHWSSYIRPWGLAPVSMQPLCIYKYWIRERGATPDYRCPMASCTWHWLRLTHTWLPCDYNKNSPRVQRPKTASCQLYMQINACMLVFVKTWF